MKLHDDLTSAGFDVWIDEKSLLGGQDWRATIKKAIRDSRYFLAILSKISIPKRGFVQKELALALDILNEVPEPNIFLIPVRIEECEPPQEELCNLHWVDMFPNWKDGLAKILKSIDVQAKKQVGDDAKVSNKTIEETKKTNPGVKSEPRGTYVPNLAPPSGLTGITMPFSFSPAEFNLWHTRSLYKENEWEDFIRTMNYFNRQHLVELLDELIHRLKTLYNMAPSPSNDPFGFHVKEELFDYSIEFLISRIIVSKKDLSSFRDYVAAHLLF